MMSTRRSAFAISIHAPRTGSDCPCRGTSSGSAGFQSTLPARGATVFSFIFSDNSFLFQSTLPARGATQCRIPAVHAVGFQSTLPARGATSISSQMTENASGFQSTLPARGATAGLIDSTCCLVFQSTLPARGATEIPSYSDVFGEEFQSTLPARGATQSQPNAPPSLSHFNPRSPHGERQDGRTLERVSEYFNPRSPHGERRVRGGGIVKIGKFQSTLPARGATRRVPRRFRRAAHFNPRSPHGERHLTVADNPQVSDISIHAPRTGSDMHSCFTLSALYISIHAPRTGSDGMGRSPCGERLRKVTILSIRIIGFAQKVYHKTVLLRISLAENAVILPEKPRNPVRTSLQKAGGLRFARAIRAARPYSISSPSGA